MSPSNAAVAVTGLGVVAPPGIGRDDFWAGLTKGISFAAPVGAFDASGLPVQFACEAPFEGESVLGAKLARRLDRFAQMALAAANEALADAGALTAAPERIAVVVGTSFGGVNSFMSLSREFTMTGAVESVNPLVLTMIMQNAAPAVIAIEHNLKGPNVSIATACAAGGHAIGEGLRLIREGAADVVVAGGSEAPIQPFVMTGFARVKVLSQRNHEPHLAARPFDRHREGFVMGEGSGFCVLERRELAEARGATPYAMLAGYAHNSDAYHTVMPAPNGEGAADCMRLAIADAGLAPSDIAHINAHGTSTRRNDAAEAAAIRAVFGPCPPPVTALKGATGHSIAAAGAIEAVGACLTIANGVIPPTANTDEPDPALGLDVVIGAPRQLPDGAVISNSFAFGGHNASLVFTPPATSHQNGVPA